MSEIDDLINRAKILVQSQKKGPKNRHNNDIFVYQDRPVRTTDWSRETDITFISIYLPSKLPTISIPYNSIVLHKHTVFESCDRNRFCHVFGWSVPHIYIRDFNYIWGYLYNSQPIRSIQLGEIDLSL